MPNEADQGLAIDGKAELVLSEKAVQCRAADQIRTAFHVATQSAATAMRDIVRCGLLMLEQKNHLNKHGQFGPWLKKHVFADCDEERFASAWRRAQKWMDLTRDVLEALGILSSDKYPIPIGSLGDMRQTGVFDFRGDKAGTHEVSLADVMVLASTALPSGVREVQLKLFELIDGKTPYQLNLELRSKHGPGGDNTPRDANGNRIQAAWGSKATEKDAVESLYHDLIRDILKLGRDPKFLSIISNPLRDELLEAGIQMNNYLRGIKGNKPN